MTSALVEANSKIAIYLHVYQAARLCFEAPDELQLIVYLRCDVDFGGCRREIYGFVQLNLNSRRDCENRRIKWFGHLIPFDNNLLNC